jgi:hypothetical protein
MKKLIVCLFLIPSLCFAQEKKDTKIIIHLSDTAGAVNKIVKVFYERGFTIDQKDLENGFVLTKERTVPDDNAASMIIKAFVKDSSVVLSGSIALNVTFSLGSAKAERTFVEMRYGGAKKSSLRLAWNELESVARLIGGKVTYSK